MTVFINKIRLINYRRFRYYTIEPNEKTNVLVGDNESGKSSILEAIDIVASGNIHRVESIGLDKLINLDAVRCFNTGVRDFDNLPEMQIELYLSGNVSYAMNGKNNTDRELCDGIRLICSPNPDYRAEVVAALTAHSDYFPYEYYSIRFSTFADEAYTGYKKKLRTVFVDSTTMNSEYATNDFIRRIYLHYTENDVKERALHNSQYRLMRNDFCNIHLKDLNNRVPVDKQYTFGLKIGSAMNLERDLMIYEGDVGIDSKGTGKQVFVKTDFALERSGENIDIILLEEPENHLSHVNLRKLIHRISDSRRGQIFISTHNSLISTRLELNNLLILQVCQGDHPVMLKHLSEETASYFVKAPPAGVVEFALSRKAILVEGPSEYMLLGKFYESIAGHVPEDDDTHIIDVRGLSFKRYLEIASQTGSKVAVLTDNDSNYQKNCVEKYSEYVKNQNIEIFFETDNNKRTFEVVLFNDNQALCQSLFGDRALEYMLNNKTEAAYKLLSQSKDIIVPDYMKRMIEWIRE